MVHNGSGTNGADEDNEGEGNLLGETQRSIHGATDGGIALRVKRAVNQLLWSLAGLKRAPGTACTNTLGLT